MLTLPKQIVERCAACDGALFLVPDGYPGGVLAVRQAAARRRYLAETVDTAHDVPAETRGHRIYCEYRRKGDDAN